MNQIHPTAVIGEDVVLGDGNVVGPFAVLSGKTEIGNDNWIGPGTMIGIAGDIVGRPTSSDVPFWEAVSFLDHEGVVIGSGNVIKENVTLHAGSHRRTRIGDNCYLMPRSHLGHDCWVGDNVLLSPSAQLAGHVAVGSRAVIGMGALIHQFSSIGPVSMVGMGCCVRGLVEPCRTVVGEPHKVSGINKVGLARFLGEEGAKKAVESLKSNGGTELPEPLSIAINDWLANIVASH